MPGIEPGAAGCIVWNVIHCAMPPSSVYFLCGKFLLKSGNQLQSSFCFFIQSKCCWLLFPSRWMRRYEEGFEPAPRLSTSENFDHSADESKQGPHTRIYQGTGTYLLWILSRLGFFYLELLLVLLLLMVNVSYEEKPLSGTAWHRGGVCSFDLYGFESGCW